MPGTEPGMTRVDASRLDGLVIAGFVMRPFSYRFVITGLDPAIPMRTKRRVPERDARIKLTAGPASGRTCSGHLDKMSTLRL
jgi:hypothetical protein